MSQLENFSEFFWIKQPSQVPSTAWDMSRDDQVQILPPGAWIELVIRPYDEVLWVSLEILLEAQFQPRLKKFQVRRTFRQIMDRHEDLERFSFYSSEQEKLMKNGTVRITPSLARMGAIRVVILLLTLCIQLLGCRLAALFASDESVCGILRPVDLNLIRLIG